MTSRSSTSTWPDATLKQVNTMKLSLSLIFAFLGLAAIAGATPVTFTDPFGVGSPDVIGALERFDIQKVVVDVTGTGVTVDIYTNYGPGTNGTSIAPYYDNGRWYNIGDLFFTVGGNLTYGVALYDHGVPNGGQSGSTIFAGQLYGINNVDAGTLTAWEALQADTGGRLDEIVLMRKSDGYLTYLGSGGVNVDTSGTNPEFKITVSIPKSVSSAFYNDLSGGNWGIHFAAATCANDIIDGQYSGVPEPGTFVMLGGALLGLGLIRRRLA